MWIAVIPLVFTLLDFTNGDRGTELISGMMRYFLMGIIALIILYFAMPILQLSGRRKIYGDFPLTVQLTDDGVSTRHPAQDALFFWTAIKDVALTRDRLFLFTTPNCAIILPSRIFSSDAQFKAWGDFARMEWTRAKSEGRAG
jgi:hypothetical protein